MEKAPFYLTKRKLKSGKTVYYYYTYDSNGNRTTPRSTGFSRKNDAFNYCISLFQKGGMAKNIIFKDFAKGWFTLDHIWLRDRQSVRKISKSTINLYTTTLNKHILPFFGNMNLNKISSLDIKNFRIHMLDNGYAAKSVNVVVGVLNIMLNFAVDSDYINKSPITSSIKPLKEEKRREAFSLDELKYIFSQKWANDTYKLFCLTAAITGLRISECNGLQPDQICDGYLNIDRQVYKNNLTPPKGDDRFVPIPKRLEKKLRSIANGNSFVFPTHFTRHVFESKIRKALTNSYSEKMLNEKGKRNLTFHSFRYFLNTYLISNNMNEEKVNFVIGHSMGKGSMMQLYTSWKPEMYDDVRELQDRLIDELMVEGFLD